jgi:hypothetical protein
VLYRWSFSHRRRRTNSSPTNRQETTRVGDWQVGQVIGLIAEIWRGELVLRTKPRLG